MAHSSRGWTGARTPQALKRVRQAARRHDILQPRRSAAKTLITKAVSVAQDGDAEAARTALIQALSALDRAAKVGAIHRNAADRRKSRLTLKLNAVLGGDVELTGARSARQTGKLATAKAAKSRIAAGKAVKAKGEQTAAGKARAALSRSTRESQAALAAETVGTLVTGSRTTTSAEGPTRTAGAKKTAAKSPAGAKSPSSAVAKASTVKASAGKAAPKASAGKSSSKTTTAKKA